MVQSCGLDINSLVNKEIYANYANFSFVFLLLFYVALNLVLTDLISFADPLAIEHTELYNMV